MPLTNKTISAQLRDAAFRGQLEIIKNLVEVENADINSSAGSLETPLINAANYGKTEVVQYLIEHNANLEIRGAYGRTALMYVVSNDYDQSDDSYLNTMHALIQSKANVNATDEDGKTALMYAAKHGNFQALDFLLKAGAKVNDVDKDGESSLIYACYSSENRKLIKTLINARADVNITNKSNNTPVMLLSSSNSNRQSIELLIQAGADRDELFRHGETELMYAVLWNDLAWIEKLLKEGVNLNAQTQSGKTALMIATQNHNKNLVEYLVKAGAIINLQDNQGYSALLHGSAHKEIVTFLIHAGADINVIAKNGETALNQAVYWKHKNIIQLLLQMHIKFEVINKKTQPSGFRDGYTPLGFAADHAINGPYDREKYRDIAILLLQNGADPTMVCDGKTALHLLSDNMSHNNEVLRALVYALEQKIKRIQTEPASIRHYCFLTEKSLDSKNDMPHADRKRHSFN